MDSSLTLLTTTTPETLFLYSTLPLMAWLFSHLFLRQQPTPTDPCPELAIAKRVRDSQSVHDICAIHGYSVEAHSVTTKDGYILTLQRILPRGSSRSNTSKRPVVYMQHGLLTSSELYMVVTSAERCIPLVLVENGFDVWMGNNRGNKYSQAHISKSTNSVEFWDFSLDEFASYDIPDSVDYVLNTTGVSRLSYVGFSQGTAQLFAALSSQPDLNDKLDIFVALAPILAPPGYASSILQSNFIHNPNRYFQIFGRYSLFPSVRTWQSILPIPVLRHVVEIALSHLFGWYCHNISVPQKFAAYPHIYCSSSVKAVVHWAQIMRNGVFGPYCPDEDRVDANGTMTSEPPRFLTETIKTPMTLLYGDRDSLFDIKRAVQHLPEHAIHIPLEGYEHIDVLWGKNVHDDVIPRILDALENRK